MAIQVWVLCIYVSAGSISLASNFLKIAISNIVKLWRNSKVNILYQSVYRIIKNTVTKSFTLFAKFYMKISTKLAPKPSIETLTSKISKHCYWKSSYRNSSYWNIDIKNIYSPNHIEPISLKFHIEPALIHVISHCFLYTNINNFDYSCLVWERYQLSGSRHSYHGCIWLVDPQRGQKSNEQKLCRTAICQPMASTTGEV